MDSAWLRRDESACRYRDWFIHIGAGRNFRTADVPFPITKKQAHHFLRAPERYSVEEALLWGEVRALGGDARLVEALLATPLGKTIEVDEDRRSFWASVYRFLIANPGLDRRHVGPIIDYLQFQRFEQQEVVTGPGRIERLPPPQPKLSMARRTPEALLRQVERWHGKLSESRWAARHRFTPSGFPGLVQPTGPRDAAGRGAEWRIRELLSGAELILEGRRLQHCVASYAGRCSADQCSIWTLERHEPDGRVHKHLTLELDPSGELVQARGRQNRLPTDAEQDVLATWCSAAGLRMGRAFTA